MKNIIVKIEIRPLNDCNLIQSSECNKIGNDMINKITDVLKDINTSEIYFDVKITAEWDRCVWKTKV